MKYNIILLFFILGCRNINNVTSRYVSENSELLTSLVKACDTIPYDESFYVYKSPNFDTAVLNSIDSTLFIKNKELEKAVNSLLVPLMSKLEIEKIYFEKNSQYYLIYPSAIDIPDPHSTYFLIAPKGNYSLKLIYKDFSSNYDSSTYELYTINDKFILLKSKIRALFL